jgi:ribosomal protein S18 acetylase RimI-like enzyme
MKLVPALSLDDQQLVRVQTIYEDGFGERLRAPFADLLTDRALVLTDGEPRGLAVLRELGPTGWVFLRYFVVGERGRGLGEQLWTHLLAAMASAGFTRIVYDVEDPEEQGIDAAEELIRRRRIGFYTRLGAVLLPANGYLPPHGTDAHPMLLMAADLDQPVTPPIEGDDMRRTMLAVYRYRYGLAHTDPIVERTLRLSGLRG